MSEQHQEASDDLGFIFSDRLPTEFEAFQSLLVHIRSNPSHKHFDPEEVECLVFAAQGEPAAQEVERITVYHPWSGKPSYRVHLGRIHLHDRTGKTEEAFSFGGDLTVQEDPDGTVFRLNSNAPIVHLKGPDRRLDLLVAEVEAALAEYRAATAHDRENIEKKLQALDPLHLYGASLLTLEQRLEAFSHKELRDYHQLLHLVQIEVERLELAKDGSNKYKDLDGLLKA